MPPLFSGVSLKVNLSDGTTEEFELSDRLLEERIGGAAICSSLMDECDDCITIGSGALTGVPCPATAAAVIGIRSKDGGKRYAPILLSAGLEFKLSGFDFIIIEGESEKPVYLWIRDQVADIVECEQLDAENAWNTCSSIRKEQGDPRIQVISSSSGDCANLNYVSGWDGIGLGGEMRSRHLKAIAFRGLGDLEVMNYEEVLAKTSEMMRATKEAIGSRAGISDLLKPEIAAKLTSLTRDKACFSCPYPCTSYSNTESDSFSQMLLMDQRAISLLGRLSGSDSALIKALMRLHMNGIYPDESSLSGISLDEIADENFSLGKKEEREYPRFDTITDNIEESDLIAAGYVLGLCPRFLGLMKTDLARYCEILSIATGETISPERIMELGRALLSEE